MKAKIAMITMLLIGMSGCDNAPSMAEMCELDAQICLDIQEDNWCKKERKAMLMANTEMHLTKEGYQKEGKTYDLLLSLETYADCMGLASQIEHIKLKEKKTKRTNNYLNAKKHIEEISEQHIDSEHPLILYFLWSRYQNTTALEDFLDMEGSAALESPEAQLHLATYYAKRDREKTLSLLFHALELYQEGEVVNYEIFKSIATIFTDKKEYKQAYIWLKVLNLYAPQDQELNEANLANYAQSFNLNATFLDQVANKTLEKINQGQFIAPRF